MSATKKITSGRTVLYFWVSERQFPQNWAVIDCRTLTDPHGSSRGHMIDDYHKLMGRGKTCCRPSVLFPIMPYLFSVLNVKVHLPKFGRHGVCKRQIRVSAGPARMP